MAYLVEYDSGLILVDAGLPGEEAKVLSKLTSLTAGASKGREKNKPLRLIYLTHAHIDHCGSAAAIREATGAPIAIHEADAAALSEGDTILGRAKGLGRLVGPLLPVLEVFYRPRPVEPDFKLADDVQLADFGIDARVLHTPGHTDGSSTLLLERRWAFAGDLVSSARRPHLQQSFAHDWQAIGPSYLRLCGLNPELIYPGHGRRPIDRKARRQLQNELLERATETAN